MDNQRIKSQIIQLMWEASDVILEVYESENINLQQKVDASPVTQADLAAHQVLVNGLAEFTPDIPVVSEEDSQSLDIPRQHQTFWLIDPLDGTKEFIHRNGEFTCNLALISDQRPVYGWVSVPVQMCLRWMCLRSFPSNARYGLLSSNAPSRPRGMHSSKVSSPNKRWSMASPVSR